ncbi:hypothetical protein V8F33_011605 [Rhypophila sp. PSN 637]
MAWETYLDSLPYHYHQHYDVQHACEELEADSSRIFSGKTHSIEVWTRENGTAVKSELDTICIRAKPLARQTTIFIHSYSSGRVTQFLSNFRSRMPMTPLPTVIHQRNSWSPLEADLSDLRNILTTHRVSPRFLEAIHAFGGNATGDDDAYLTSVRHRLLERSPTEFQVRQLFLLVVVERQISMSCEPPR